MVPISTILVSSTAASISSLVPASMVVILQSIIQGTKLSPYIFIKLVDTVMKTSLLPMILFVDDLLFICKRSELESAIQEISDRSAEIGIINSARSKLRSLNASGVFKNNFKHEHLLRCVGTFILPILEYGLCFFQPDKANA